MQVSEIIARDFTTGRPAPRAKAECGGLEFEVFLAQSVQGGTLHPAQFRAKRSDIPGNECSVLNRADRTPQPRGVAARR